MTKKTKKNSKDISNNHLVKWDSRRTIHALLKITYWLYTTICPRLPFKRVKLWNYFFGITAMLMPHTVLKLLWNSNLTKVIPQECISNRSCIFVQYIIMPCLAGCSFRQQSDACITLINHHQTWHASALYRKKRTWHILYTH